MVNNHEAVSHIYNWLCWLVQSGKLRHHSRSYTGCRKNKCKLYGHRCSCSKFDSQSSSTIRFLPDLKFCSPCNIYTSHYVTLVCFQPFQPCVLPYNLCWMMRQNELEWTGLECAQISSSWSFPPLLSTKWEQFCFCYCFFFSHTRN